MSTWQGKSRGTKTGYRIFVWVLRNLGISAAYLLLNFVVLYYLLFSWKSSRWLFNFYSNRMGYSCSKSIRYIHRNYSYLGQGIIDKVVTMSGLKNNFTFNFDGEDNLREIVGLRRGGMLLSAHIGNWDIAGHLFDRLATTINIVIFDGEYQQIKQYLDSVTGRRSVNAIVIKDDLSHIYAIDAAFKNNELVCMHADRFIEGNRTLTSVLCGEKARFPMGPFLLAAKFKVPVSFVFAVKESNLHYHFFASSIREYGQLPKNGAMQVMLDDFAKEMESKVKHYPDQWFNYYNFWEKQAGQ
ncbi:MAG: lipid A biosynthesis acyltransferase [Ferruginibacter sp.]